MEYKNLILYFCDTAAFSVVCESRHKSSEVESGDKYCFFNTLNGARCSLPLQTIGGIAFM